MESKPNSWASSQSECPREKWLNYYSSIQTWNKDPNKLGWGGNIIFYLIFVAKWGEWSYGRAEFCGTLYLKSSFLSAEIQVILSTCTKWQQRKLQEKAFRERLMAESRLVVIKIVSFYRSSTEKHCKGPVQSFFRQITSKWCWILLLQSEKHKWTPDRQKIFDALTIFTARKAFFSSIAQKVPLQMDTSKTK